LVPLLSTSFIFGEGKWILEVNQDPDLYYLEEEMVLSLRSFSHKYDIYTPSQIVAWHRNNRDGNNKHYKNHPIENVQSIMQISANQLKNIIEEKPMEYGLGKERKLSEFQFFFGINFKTKKITEKDFLVKLV
jgi:hypothetical protein